MFELTRQGLLDRIEEIDSEFSSLLEERHKILLFLSKDCKHELLSNFSWEHDDGYGRQKMMIGSKCCICGLIDHWNKKEKFKGA